MPTIRERFTSAWNAFTKKDDVMDWQKVVRSSYVRSDRRRLIYGSERTIISSIYTRIAVDVSMNEIRHVYLDENGNYINEIDSRLNYALKVESNIDQTARSAIQDIVTSMCDEGVVALVPVEATADILQTRSFDVINFRCCKITDWHPQHITVDVYNEITGLHESVTLPKAVCCILENPLYSVMNEPNSTLQRLIRKLMLLDAIDDSNGGNKLDLIIQLPYVIKSEAQRTQADARIAEIERQMNNSKYGIAYTDGTEKVVQLNRAIENNIFNQIQYYTDLLYSQLGLSKGILDGTASEQELMNYNNRTIVPFLNTITEEMKRKWLSKTSISQGQSIIFFNNPFKSVPVEKVASITDTFSRNAILSSNEIRAIFGYKPVDDPDADALRNKNLNISEGEMAAQGRAPTEEYPEGAEEMQEGQVQPEAEGSEEPMYTESEVQELLERIQNQEAPQEIKNQQEEPMYTESEVIELIEKLRKDGE